MTDLVLGGNLRVVQLADGSYAIAVASADGPSSDVGSVAVSSAVSTDDSQNVAEADKG